MMNKFWEKNPNQSSQIGLFASGLALGGIIGAGMALLLAPHSGDEVRSLISEKSIELKDQLSGKVNQVHDQVDSARQQIESRQRSINDQAFGSS
jgi:gas vesicle protein